MPLNSRYQCSNATRREKRSRERMRRRRKEMNEEGW
jgi:hypothetical protein